MAASDEETIERCMEAYREEKVKRCITQSKKRINEQFERKMNEDVNGNRKPFWKEVSNAKGGKDGNGRLAQGEDEARKIWKSILKICII